MLPLLLTNTTTHHWTWGLSAFACPQVAGATSGGHHLDGQSLLDLLRAGDGDSEEVAQREVVDEATRQPAWRAYVGLEHDICYNITNHWNALTDGEQ